MRLCLIEGATDTFLTEKEIFQIGTFLMQDNKTIAEDIPELNYGSLTLNVTSGCNLACKYCFANTSEKHFKSTFSPQLKNLTGAFDFFEKQGLPYGYAFSHTTNYQSDINNTFFSKKQLDDMGKWVLLYCQSAFYRLIINRAQSSHITRYGIFHYVRSFQPCFIFQHQVVIYFFQQNILFFMKSFKT